MFSSRNLALPLEKLRSNLLQPATPLMWIHRGVFGLGKGKRASLAHIELQVALLLQDLAVMLVEAIFLYALNVREVCVKAVACRHVRCHPRWLLHQIVPRCCPTLSKKVRVGV